MVWNQDTLTALATQQTEALHVNTAHFIATMDCEILKDKDRNWIASGQSQIPDKTGPNGLEDSWGPMMIHLPDHKEVTKDDAINPIFAIPWAVREFAAGNAHNWTCYRNLYMK